MVSNAPVISTKFKKTLLNLRSITTGSWWLSYGATLTPFYNAFGAYSSDANNPSLGLSSQGFASSFAFYLTFMALFSLICTICALRTNIALVGVEFGLTMNFILLAASFFISGSAPGAAASLQTVSYAIFLCDLNIILMNYRTRLLVRWVLLPQCQLGISFWH